MKKQNLNLQSGRHSSLVQSVRCAMLTCALWLFSTCPAELMAQTAGERISAAAVDTGEKLQEAGRELR